MFIHHSYYSLILLGLDCPKSYVVSNAVSLPSGVLVRFVEMAISYKKVTLT
tara:strand:- start:44 stop:196 length:153 start_codon:yes stop_codon:yes gene_type:complete